MDQRLYAPTQSLSQLTTSFIAAQCQGIRHTPLFRFKNFKVSKHHSLQEKNGAALKRILLLLYLVSFAFDLSLLLKTKITSVIKNCFPICQRTLLMCQLANMLMCQLNWLMFRFRSCSTTLSSAHLVFIHLSLYFPSFPATHSYQRKKKSGGYRSRTDDPLRARQVL